MIARLVGTPVLGARFLDYLAPRLGVRHLWFAEGPAQITDGLETFIYRFRLGAREPLPEPFDRPLIIRIYSSLFGLPQLRQEVAAQRFLRPLGYPVPRPLLAEEECDLFSGPFEILECLPGRPLLDLFLRQPWRLIGGPWRFAAVHARLHRLPAEGFPSPPGSLLDRRLEELRGWIEGYDLAGLKPGLDWLMRNRPPEPETPSILHLDFHPGNVLRHGGDWSGVVDWGDSDIGDRHADVATTLVLMRTAPVAVPGWERPFCGLARWHLRTGYLRWYHWQWPLDRGKLSYYTALASLRRLTRWGLWVRATPRITGSKPSAIRYLSADHVGSVARCFWEETGIAIDI